MLTIGSTVYWIDGNNNLKRGEVMAINAISHDGNGKPKQVCVCVDGEFIIRSNRLWDAYSESIDEAVEHGMERLAQQSRQAHTDLFILRQQAKRMKANPPTPNE